MPIFALPFLMGPAFLLIIPGLLLLAPLAIVLAPLALLLNVPGVADWLVDTGMLDWLETIGSGVFEWLKSSGVWDWLVTNVLSHI